MIRLTPWRSRTALFLAISMTSAATLPLLTASSTRAQTQPLYIAQLLEQRLDYRLPSGTVIPVEYDDAERVIVKPDETVEVSLVVSADVQSPNNRRVVIPAGSIVSGELRPDGEGAMRFVAESVEFVANGSTSADQAIAATSERLTNTEIISEDSNPDIIRGAAIGAAAAAILSEVLGDIGIIEVIGGAGLGVLAEILINNGKNDEVEVLVIERGENLDLTLQSEFVRAD